MGGTIVYVWQGVGWGFLFRGVFASSCLIAVEATWSYYPTATQALSVLWRRGPWVHQCTHHSLEVVWPISGCRGEPCHMLVTNNILIMILLKLSILAIQLLNLMQHVLFPRNAINHLIFVYLQVHVLEIRENTIGVLAYLLLEFIVVALQLFIVGALQLHSISEIFGLRESHPKLLTIVLELISLVFDGIHVSEVLLVLHEHGIWVLLEAGQLIP